MASFSRKVFVKRPVLVGMAVEFSKISGGVRLTVGVDGCPLPVT